VSEVSAGAESFLLPRPCTAAFSQSDEMGVFLSRSIGVRARRRLPSVVPAGGDDLFCRPRKSETVTAAYLLPPYHVQCGHSFIRNTGGSLTLPLRVHVSVAVVLPCGTHVVPRSLLLAKP
jgi:hypothetical protein